MKSLPAALHCGFKPASAQALTTAAPTCSPGLMGLGAGFSTTGLEGLSAHAHFSAIRRVRLRG
jgi:hypothetical protein